MKTGDVVDQRFRLAEQLGAGGMGVVFRAIDQTTGSVVAVKLLAAGSEADIARARREAQLLAGLAHPAIVQHVADGLTGDGQLYLAMEWIDGITAAERIAEDGFSLAEAVAILRHVASALAAAHAAGVLHRDVKPSNVLLADGSVDVVKLIDFGVARTTHGHALTRTGTAVGTPGYMAPEQARGERALTAAVDVFGLGSLFYECATGRPAFSGVQRAAVLAKVLFADPPPFARLCPDAPPALVELVERMLAKDPARRVPDGAALVAALASIGAIPIGARHVGARLNDATARVPAPPTTRPVTAPGHCFVLAACGHPDEPIAPIEPTADLYRGVTAHGATLELLDTGAVAAHFTGTAADVAPRAARCALAMHGLLPTAAIAISAIEASTDAAADAAATLLAAAAMAAIFSGGRSGQIVVDPRTAKALGDAFELSRGAYLVLRGENRGPS